MARYQVTTPDGRTAVIEGDTPPTDDDLDYLFSAEGMVDRSVERATEGAVGRTAIAPGEEAAVAGAMRRSSPSPRDPEFYSGPDAAREAGEFSGLNDSLRPTLGIVAAGLGGAGAARTGWTIAKGVAKAATSPTAGAIAGGIEGYKRGGLGGAFIGAGAGASGARWLGRGLRSAGSGVGALVDRVKALRSIRGATQAASTAAPAAEAAPAVLSKAEASAQLQALLGKAVHEGQVTAAAREAAKGNRQLAEQILAQIKR